MEYRVGQKVKIVCDNPESQRNVGPSFTTDMDRYIGQVVTIQYVSTKTVQFEEIGYSWNKNWIRPIKEEPILLKDFLDE